MKRRPSPKSRKKTSEVVRLEDLTPRHMVKGGAGPRVFGEPPEPPDKDRQDSQPDERRRP
jgi:hypothetical protein